MLLSKVRERDIIGNNIPENIVKAEERLEALSDTIIREVEAREWSSKNYANEQHS
jgi:hypothetical protein